MFCAVARASQIVTVSRSWRWSQRVQVLMSSTSFRAPRRYWPELMTGATHNAPGGVIAANRSTVGDCEKFWIESSRRVLRKLTLRTCYNTYVGVDTEGRVSANRLQEAQLESFVINWPNPHQTICSFRTHLGTFLGAPDDSGHTLVGDSPAALANELFNMKLED
eukprot:m51a1_g12994 hypothetical protein (164) ;mRNA; f:30-2166